MDIDYEKRFIPVGYTAWCGIDEAGIGPLAGPVSAAAVVLHSLDAPFIPKLTDSKKLSPKKREAVFEELTNSEHVTYGTALVEHDEIDRLNIFHAARKAMAVAYARIKPRPLFALVDGRFDLKKLSIQSRAVVGGDGLCISIAAASIIAKVIRDRIMLAYHEQYPQYGFDKHKGYPSKVHLAAIKEHGICPIHRRSYGPCRPTRQA